MPNINFDKVPNEGSEADFTAINQRNRLRAARGLPLLSIEVEVARLMAAREQAAFERQWTRRRNEFAVDQQPRWLADE